MNIVNLINYYQEKFPFKKAVIVASGKDGHGNNRYSHLTYQDLWRRSDQLAFHLVEKGLQRGQKILIFVRPSLSFSILTLALFKIGVIPVLIDPGMGRKNLLKAISETKPELIVSVWKGLLLRYLLFWRFSFLKKSFSVTEIEKIIERANSSEEDRMVFPIADFQDEETSAILFTSGGTGAPKGVSYTHKILIHQVQMLREMFSLSEEDVDLPGFPFFYLFSLSMGMSVVFPDMDPTRPSQSNPEKLIKQISDFGVTFMAGSPAIWRRVAIYATERKMKLESVRILAMFGAPVSMDLHQMFHSILINGDTYTPYGATEALPITNISGKTLLSEALNLYHEGRGLLVGMPVKGVEVKVIKTEKKMIPHIDEAILLPPREVGEIIVSGVNVTTQYFQKPIPTAMSKIHDPLQNKIWHRMGDVGFLDEHGRLWFMGRKDHQVLFLGKTLYPVQVEAIYDRHPKVKKSVLIGTKIPSIVIERIDGKTQLSFDEKNLFEKELRDLSQPYSWSRDITQFFYTKNLPVDIRHQIKIDRILLKEKFTKRDERI